MVIFVENKPINEKFASIHVIIFHLNCFCLNSVLALVRLCNSVYQFDAWRGSDVRKLYLIAFQEQFGKSTNKKNVIFVGITKLGDTYCDFV